MERGPSPAQLGVDGVGDLLGGDFLFGQGAAACDEPGDTVPAAYHGGGGRVFDIVFDEPAHGLCVPDYSGEIIIYLVC